MPTTKADWVSPSGRIYNVDTDTHINLVIKKPSMFGWNLKNIKKVHEKYGESLGSEGKARHEIMVDILQRGWLRTRQDKRSGIWVVETWNWGNREKNALWDWTNEKTNSGKSREFVRLTSVKNNKMVSSPSDDILRWRGSMFEDIRKQKLLENIWKNYQGVDDELTLEHLAVAIYCNDKDKINEASLGRVYQHIKKQASKSFTIITAFRGGYSLKQNKSRNKKLGSNIRSLGFGFFKVKGYWVECQDESLEYKDCPDDLKVPVVEYAYFVPNIIKKDVVKLAKKYDQDAIIYQGEETDDKVELISKSGLSIMKLGKFSPDKIKQAYTQVKGHTFVFEGFEYQPTGQLENLSFQAYLKNIEKN